MPACLFSAGSHTTFRWVPPGALALLPISLPSPFPLSLPLSISSSFYLSLVRTPNMRSTLLTLIEADNTAGLTIGTSLYSEHLELTHLVWQTFYGLSFDEVNSSGRTRSYDKCPEGGSRGLRFGKSSRVLAFPKDLGKKKSVKNLCL